jgi:hypothetical protein
MSVFNSFLKKQSRLDYVDNNFSEPDTHGVSIGFCCTVYLYGVYFVVIIILINSRGQGDALEFGLGLTNQNLVAHIIRP